MKEGRVCYNCGGEYYVKGLCKACYQRMWRNGSLERRKRGRPAGGFGEKTTQILEAYKSSRPAGTMASLAREFGVSREYVRQVIQRYYKPTNADKIRAMTDEELAAWQAKLPCCPPGVSLEELYYSVNSREDTDFGTKRWLNWLQKEAE